MFGIVSIFHKTLESRSLTRQEIGEAVVSAFGCSGLFEIVRGGEDKAAALRKFVVAYMDHIDSLGTDMNDITTHAWEEVRSIGESYARATRFCKAIMFLLQIPREGMMNDFRNVLYFSSYSGKLVFEKAVKTALCEEGTYYELLCQECLKTAATTKTLEPKLQNFRVIINKAGPLGLDDLVTASTTFEELRSGMRKGSLSTEEVIFLDKLKEMGNELVAPSDASPRASTAEIKALMKALAQFEAVPGALDLHHSVQKWMTTHKAALAAKDLSTGLSNMIKNRDFQPAKLIELVNTCERTMLGEEVLARMDEYLANCLEITAAQVLGLGSRFSVLSTTMTDYRK